MIDAVVAARQQREQGEAPGGEAEARRTHRPSAARSGPTDGRTKRNGEELHRRADQQRVEREAAALGGDVDEEGQREDGEDVIGDVLADPEARRRARPRRAARGARRSPAASAAPPLRRAPLRTSRLSATRLRMYQPTATSIAESRNGTRQPQARKSASLWRPAISASTPAASRLPAATPACGQLAQKPRRAASPCSAAISTAPPHSPPTAKPWTRRSTISAIGAQTPICA